VKWLIIGSVVLLLLMLGAMYLIMNNPEMQSSAPPATGTPEERALKQLSIP
jgi:hypothetical protein